MSIREHYLKVEEYQHTTVMKSAKIDEYVVGVSRVARAIFIEYTNEIRKKNTKQPTAFKTDLHLISFSIINMKKCMINIVGYFGKR